MERIIKFRYWDKDEGVFGYVDFTDGGEVYCPKDSLPLQQFTGLFDRNSKEIYEGDIVRFYPERTDYIRGEYEVAFRSGAFYMKHDTEDDLKLPTPPYKEFFKVVRNIYEN